MIQILCKCSFYCTIFHKTYRHNLQLHGLMETKMENGEDYRMVLEPFYIYDKEYDSSGTFQFQCLSNVLPNEATQEVKQILFMALI